MRKLIKKSSYDTANKFNWRLELSQVTYSFDIVADVNCDFDGDNIIDVKSVSMASYCSELCVKTATCTAFTLIGTGPYLCEIKKGDFTLENAKKTKFNSKCGFMRSLYCITVIN